MQSIFYVPTHMYAFWENYAASEYAWESATPSGTALMMLDTNKMVVAASSHNPTLASALTRFQIR